MSEAISRVEVWGGLECTRNRVGDTYFDQIDRCGHRERPSDISLIAALGITTLRYPVLWDRLCDRSTGGEIDWRWTDLRMRELREHGIDPIVGLLHHGSGPCDTDLSNEAFPNQLANFARRVAQRYPLVRRWTPINEPLTTARFSMLYGHWYPHARDDRLFSLALVRQCRAIAEAMRAIREVNSEAQLVQTEDIGKAYATKTMQYQADFENERRWLTFDLLCGMVDEEHGMWAFLRDNGVPQNELAALVDMRCTPDVFGINHYVTSERFLDEDVQRHPRSAHGGNGVHTYADVEAARVLAEGIGGARAAIAAAWARYSRPLAVTEAHLSCSREQQLRWLHEVWSAACEARSLGVDVLAITVWSLLGAYDWHNLVTAAENRYEPGAFDVRSAQPRPTAIATMTRALAREGRFDHPVLAEPGWWRSTERGTRATVACANARSSPIPASPRSSAPILITGGSGTLGQAFGRVCKERHLSHRLTTRAELDISSPSSVEAMLDAIRPWALINAAGYVRVDDAELEHERCDRENCVGPAVLAAACARRGVAFLTFSSDLVFDGTQTRPYVESDGVRPLGNYGMSKVAAERVVLQRMPAALVVRTSAFFGPWDTQNFVTQVLAALSRQRTFAAANDEVISATYVPDLAGTALDLLIDGEHGIWHLANVGALTWYELAMEAATLMDIDPRLIEGRPGRTLGRPAARPTFSALGSERGHLMPNVSDALARYAAVKRVALRDSRSGCGVNGNYCDPGQRLWQKHHGRPVAKSA